MHSKQEARLNMYHAVIAHCNANPAIVATVVAFQTTLTSFKAKVSSIQTTAQQEAQVISGVATDKKVLRASLCQQGADIAAVVYAYAASIGNNTLKESMAFSRSDLRNMRDDQLAPTSLNIHDTANANLVSLAFYGITAPMLASFNSLIEDYSDAVPTPRNAAVLRKTYSAELKTLFIEADSLLTEQMDKTAVQFKAANLQFYDAYKNNRIIIDAATSATQVKGIVTDNATDNPLNAVVVTVQDQSYTTTTDHNGNYTLKIPVHGFYKIIFTKAGYVVNAAEVDVKIGQTSSLDITLTPIPV
jgi:hypothetical protein